MIAEEIQNLNMTIIQTISAIETVLRNEDLFKQSISQAQDEISIIDITGGDLSETTEAIKKMANVMQTLGRKFSKITAIWSESIK